MSMRQAIIALFVLSSCDNASGGREAASISDFSPPGWATKSASLIAADGEPVGRAAFAETSGGILIRIEATGLTPGWHGMHFHAVADCSDGADGFAASGAHVNPGGFAHGLQSEDGGHVADLPNIRADASGRAVAELFRPGLDLAETEAGASQGHPALLDADGFALVIHEAADDHVSQPIGGAGARVACAAIRG